MQASDLVLTHAYEGGHADHDAVAYAVHAAHRLSRGTSVVAEMPFYHGDATGWVRQTWLPHPAAGPEHVVALTGAERDLKARMVAAHATQAETLRSFALDVERVRVAPPYRFDRLPHAGPLLYERHGWNLTGPQWLARVAAADMDLGLGPA